VFPQILKAPVGVPSPFEEWKDAGGADSRVERLLLGCSQFAAIASIAAKAGTTRRDVLET